MKAAGNSTIVKNYTFNDTHPYAGINYYRLLQIDYNGKFSFSKTVSANFNYGPAKFLIYPNPADEIIYCAIDFKQSGKIKLEIINGLGKTVLTSSQNVTAGKNVLKNNISKLSKGVYHVRITTDDFQAAVNAVFLKN